LPENFPGKADHARDPSNPTPYVLALEAAFGADIRDLRFIPHLQLHEYETMLFADPDAFRYSFDQCDSAVQSLGQIASQAQTIEHINDGPETAPSKHIIRLIPEYDGRKVTAGPDIAEYIGVNRIRQKCPHFNSWLSRLENLFWETA
jgi:hypothetical protein